MISTLRERSTDRPINRYCQLRLTVSIDGIQSRQKKHWLPMPEVETFFEGFTAYAIARA